MQMQSEASEPKKSKFGVFREIPKDAAVGRSRASGNKHREQKLFRHLGVWGIVVLGGGLGVCFFLGGGLLDCFGVIFFLKVLFAF